jgi:hypothetical protein
VKRIEKGQGWAPEGGDEPHEVKLQTEGIILHHRKNCVMQLSTKQH